MEDPSIKVKGMLFSALRALVAKESWDEETGERGES